MSVIRQQQAEDLRDVAAIAIERFGEGKTNRIQYQNWVLQQGEGKQVEVSTLDKEPVLKTRTDGSIHSYNHFLADYGTLTQNLRGEVVQDVTRDFLERTGQTDFTSEKYGYHLQTDGRRFKVSDSSDRTLLFSQLDANSGQATLFQNRVGQEDVERFHHLGQAIQEIAAQRTAPRLAVEVER